MKKIKFYLTSGNILSFQCEELEWEYNKATGKISKYSIKGINTNKPYPAYVSCESIEAIEITS